MDVLDFVGGKLAPFAGLEATELHVHDARSFELDDTIPQKLAHAPNLAVETLGEYDIKGGVVDGHHRAGLSDGAQDGHPAAHFFEKIGGDGLIDGHDVLLFVLVARPQDLVDDIAVVGQKDEALGVFVEAPDGEEALRVIDKPDDVLGLFQVGGTYNTHGLIEGDVQRFGLGGQWAAVDVHRITREYAVARLSRLAVDGHAAIAHHGVYFAARAQARTADVLV